MGSLVYTQQTTISVALASSTTAFGCAPAAQQYDFQINPAQIDTIQSWSEDAGVRYSLAIGASLAVGMGSLQQASVLIMQPDVDIEVQLTNSLALTGNTTSSSTTVAVSSIVGLTVGQVISGTGIPSNTTISAISAGQIILSQAATATGTSVALTTTSVSPLIYVNGGCVSVLHCNFTAISITNPSATVVATGKIFMAGN
jgi:hypothetical protein